MIRPVWFILTEKMNKFQRVIIFVEMIIISFEKYDVWKVEDLSLQKLVGNFWRDKSKGGFFISVGTKSTEKRTKK